MNITAQKVGDVLRDVERATSDYLATSRACEHYTTAGYLIAEAQAWDRLEAALLAAEVHCMGVTA